MAGVLVWSRHLIIGFWLAVAVASVTLLPTITQTHAGSGVDGAVPSDSATIATEIRAFEQFGFPLLSRAVIVQNDPRGLPLSVQAEAVQREWTTCRMSTPTTTCPTRSWRRWFRAWGGAPGGSSDTGLKGFRTLHCAGLPSGTMERR